MAEVSLSLGEKTYLLHGIDSDFRNDGRKRCEYRSMEVETKIMPQSHGSARLRIGNSDILVSVKVEIDTPLIDRPEEGKLEFFVDCSANATPEFEGKGGDDLAMEISNILTSAYQSSKAFDLKSLIILPYKKCWKLYVDILILQCGGNLYDAVGAAVKSALFSAEIPAVRATELDGGEAEIELSDNPHDCVRLNVTNVPIIVTVCKVGEHCIVDSTSEEEACSSLSIVMSVIPDGHITSLIKLGYGSMQPTTFENILEIGKDIGIKFNQGLMKALLEEQALGPQRPIFGFLR